MICAILLLPRLVYWFTDYGNIILTAKKTFGITCDHAGISNYGFLPSDGMNGPMASNPLSLASAANPNSLLGGRMDSNLAKWFGSELLKQQTTGMPALPQQGKKVMTVDEIERCQQMVTH